MRAGTNPYAALARDTGPEGSGPRWAARPPRVAAEVRAFLGTPAASQLLRPEAEAEAEAVRVAPRPWYVAVWRDGGRVLGARAEGTPPGAGRGFLRRNRGAFVAFAVAPRGRRPGPDCRPSIVWVRRAEPPAKSSAASGASWTGVYFDREAPLAPPGHLLEKAARAFSGPAAARLPRGCLVLTHRAGALEAFCYCPGPPPATGSELTEKIRRAVATYDGRAALLVLCVDCSAKCTALALVALAARPPPGPSRRERAAPS